MTHLSHAKALTGLVITAAAVTGLAAPAHAAFQKTVQLTCEYPLIGTVPVSARFTAGIPQSVPAGMPTPQYPVTIDQISGTNAETATSSWEALKIIRAASISGVTTTSATVRAPDLEEPITFDATLAKYVVPATDQDLILQATGTLPSLTFPRRGLATIDIDGFALNLRALRNDGLPVVGLPPITVDSDGDPNTFDVPCAVDAGQNTTLAEFSIGDPATPEELPTKPGTPVASAITTTGATLTWGASTDTAGPTPGVVRYDVYEGSKKVGTTDGTSLVVTGLAPGAHTVTVRAIDGDGNYSAASDAVTFTVERPPNTAPSQPGKPTAGTITPTSIDVYWAASNDPYDTVRYEVQEGGVVVAESDVNLVRVSGLTPDAEHCFTVVAIDAAGLRSEPSEETCFTTPLPTPSPTPTPPPTPRPTPGPGAFTLNSELPLVGSIPFLVDLKAQISATVPVGAGTSSFAIAGTLTGGTDPETATSLWRTLKIYRATSIEGVARLNVTVNGGGIDNLSVAVDLDIEKYVPPVTEQDLPLVVRGSTPPLRFTQATPVGITINSITLNLRGTKADGTPVRGLPPVSEEDSDGNPDTFDAPGVIEGGPFKLGNGTIVLPGGTPTPRPTPTPVGLPTPYPTPTPTPRSTPVIGIPIPSPTPTPTPRPTPVPGTPVPTVKPTPWPTPVPGTPVPTVKPTPTPTPTPRPTPVIGIPIPSPTPTPPPTTKLDYDLTGTATLKRLAKGTLPLKGSVAATLEGSSGKVSADLNLQPTKARLTALGFLPVTASVAFVPNGKTTGTLLGSTLQATSNVRIKLPQVSVLGLPIAGGTTCQTRELSKIDLSSTAFSAAAGGTLSGTFAISNLSGCGILNGLVSPLTAGGGNTISAKLTPAPTPTA